MGLLLYTLVNFLIAILDCMGYVLMGYIILGWIIFFGVIKNRDSFLLKIYVFLMTKTEPLLSVIRRFIPSVFGLDFSALVVFLALHFVKLLIIQFALLL
jgi:YggT family protein